MSEIERNFEFRNIVDQNKNNTHRVCSFQKNNWEKIKILIKNNIKEIFWKAWIKPLTFEKYEDGILYLSTDCKIITNRAETQYYEDIFFQSSKYFDSLKKIKFLYLPLSQKEDEIFENNEIKTKVNEQKIYNDLPFVESVSMKLNTKYTFDNFVVGETNRMPYAASKRVCQNIL